MLMIRSEQMQALGQSMRQRFVSRMADELPQRCPDEVKNLSHEDLRAMVDEGIDVAKQYGITDETDVRAFLWFIAQFGLDFSQTPETAWAGETLANDELSGFNKMTQIEEDYLFEMR